MGGRDLHTLCFVCRARDDITKFGRDTRFPLERRYKRVTLRVPRECRYEFRVLPSRRAVREQRAPVRYAISG